MELGPWIEKHFVYLEKLELKIKAIMDAGHVKAGLIWRGKEETGGQIGEISTSAKS